MKTYTHTNIYFNFNNAFRKGPRIKKLNNIVTAITLFHHSY